jgi:hypothetical protein
MKTIPPPPFPRKGATSVQPPGGFRFLDWLPPWGGSAEAA